LALAELEASRAPLVMLAPDPDEPRWEALRGVVLRLDADPALVRRGLEAAVRGERLQPASSAQTATGQLPAGPATAKAAEIHDAPLAGIDTATVIAVASGPGSPGRSTIALNLAAGLGAVEPTVLVDCDLAGPSAAALLDADPSRNLYMIAHDEPEAAWEWDRAIQGEVQPLHPRSPHAAVLCGVPKPDMRARLSRRFLERLVAGLQRRYQFIILDVGPELLGPEGAVHRAALGLSQQVLLVCSTDVVGLWRARYTLGLLETHIQVNPARVALVLNKHDPRHHHTRTEVEWALGLPAAAVIPFDHHGLERALAARAPVVLERRSGAGRALLEFAERVHGGKVVLPPDPERAARRRWPGLPRFRRRGAAAPPRPAEAGGSFGGGDA
jgi:MinD-like ATPase involved in chromosome partitioning or flagellar assembly